MYPPTVDEIDWNAIVDHAFQKECGYVIRQKGSNYEAIHGDGSNQAGKILSGSTSTYLDATINAALANLTSAGSKIILNLVGIHTLNDSIINQNHPVTLQGLGGGEFTISPNGLTVLKAKSGFNKSLIRSIGSSGTEAPIYLRDLTLDGNRTNQTVAAPALSLEGYCRTTILERVGICRVLGEPWKTSGVTNQDFWMDKCQLEDCSKGVYHGAVGYYVWIQNSYFINLSTTGLYIAGGQWLSLKGVHIMGSQYHGLWMAGSVQFDAIGCHFSGNNKASGDYNDIELSGACDTGTIVGCTSRTQTGYADKPKYCLHISSTSDYIIAVANVFKDYDVAPVFTESGGNLNGDTGHNVG